jgi:hypothetical protein
MANPWEVWDDMPGLVDANGASSGAPRNIPPPMGAAMMPPAASRPPPRPAPPPTNMQQYPWGTPYPQYVSDVSLVCCSAHSSNCASISTGSRICGPHRASITTLQLIHPNQRRVRISPANLYTLRCSNRTVRLHIIITIISLIRVNRKECQTRTPHRQTLASGHMPIPSSPHGRRRVIFRPWIFPPGCQRFRCLLPTLTTCIRPHRPYRSRSLPDLTYRLGCTTSAPSSGDPILNSNLALRPCSAASLPTPHGVWTVSSVPFCDLLCFLFYFFVFHRMLTVCRYG